MNLRTKKAIFAMVFAGVAMSNVVTSFAATKSTTIRSEDAQYSVSASVDYNEIPFTKDHIVYYAGMQGKDVKNGASTWVKVRGFNLKTGYFDTFKSYNLNVSKVSVSGRITGVKNKTYRLAEVRFKVDNRERNVIDYNSDLD